MHQTVWSREWNWKANGERESNWHTAEVLHWTNYTNKPTIWVIPEKCQEADCESLLCYENTRERSLQEWVREKCRSFTVPLLYAEVLRAGYRFQYAYWVLQKYSLQKKKLINLPNLYQILLKHLKNFIFFVFYFFLL